MALPSLSEQSKIIEYLSSKLENIGNLIEKTKRSIDLLKERRSALISAAVTGQIDVRGTELNP
jgi:type I restriction enzyme S subunit